MNDEWDAEVTLYCDDHAENRLGPAWREREVPVRRGVVLIGQWRRWRVEREAVWRPESIISTGGDVVWTPRSHRWLNGDGNPVSVDDPVVGELDRLHVVLRHRNCRRALRLTHERLSVLLDSLAAQGITGASLAFLELVNTRT